MKTRFLVTLLVLGLVGCGTIGPHLTSPAVYGSAKGKIVAKNQAEESYWQELGKSYQASDRGGVVTKKRQLKSPAKYHHGALINPHEYQISLNVSGPKSLIAEVPAATKVGNIIVPGMIEVDLPGKSNYYVEAYCLGGSSPYRRGSFFIDDEEGDAPIITLAPQKPKTEGITPVQPNSNTPVEYEKVEQVFDFLIYAP